MHGRVKVRTSEEQAAAKKLEREKKIKKYQGVTEEIYARREAGSLDEELLKLTETLLAWNPDHYTVWNIRREVIVNILTYSEVEAKTELFKRELHFLEMCLKVNPKSYGTFMQRRWVMSNNPDPDWKHELALCDLFLSYDERNFHCWDYRRFSIGKSEISPMEELEFSQKKIESNLSNYSAWHYRSKLLPLCYPADTLLPSVSADSSSVQEDKLLQEFDIVTNAIFTDPNDQSTWFYQQWLLGRAHKEERLLFFMHFPSNQMLLLVFNQPVNKDLLNEVQVLISGNILQLEWSAHGSPPTWPCSLWTAVLISVDTSVNLECRFRERALNLFTSSVCAPSVNLEEIGPAISLTAAKSGVLHTHCEAICELLSIEPDNKWCHLTALQLRWAIDPDSSAAKIMDHFSALEKEDPHRKGCYQDMKSKFLIETGIPSFLKKRDFSHLNLSGLGLTRLYHTHFFSAVSILDLSNNRLTNMQGLSVLVTCQELNLDGNLLTEVEEDILFLIRLRILSLKSNLIEKEDSLLLLEKIDSIHQLNIEGNPILKERDSSLLINLFSNLILNCGATSTS
ncbi:Geranylgeranyl transferase type-2 subunit alpha-like [Oopsacas minuta]|uniref:Geranylgeranyl transferase type-2 subunit alpha n=1 Tax=Oopsacas minuta TaxID=111878 RepID=A0AAV7K1M9_9METZ|nr:Geranylgeranyl transferase type-2 subunit alpha-like [Oopsacas minuta]